MIQIPPNITVKQKYGQEAAMYLNQIVNQEAQQGWEFHRVDTIGVEVAPGCLQGLLGQSNQTHHYYVVSFRRGQQ